MKSKIGIFRALDVRVSHAEFAASFHDFKPVFLANLSGELRKYAESKKIEYHTVPLKSKLLIDPIYPLLKKRDFTPWLEFDPDVLRTVISGLEIYEIYEPYFFYSAQIAEMAKKQDVPLITEIWTSFPEHPSQYVPPYSLFVKKVIHQTDLFLLRSQKALTYLDRFNIPASRKEVVYQGVNTDRFYPSQKKQEKITILFVGALAAHKGLDDLLAVFSELIHKYPQKLELVICGEGPLKESILTRSQTLPISYRGYVPHEDLPEIYRSADIYCQPSKDFYWLGIKGGEEFAGYTFMEALASGLPIVSTYCGGIPEIVGTDNTLITQGNRKQLYEALDAYIVDRNLRTKTGIKNRNRAEKLFDLDRQTKLLEKIIKDKLM